MDHLTEILVPIACGCILPIVAIVSGVRKKINETNQRTQIVLAAIEKNPDMDIEEMIWHRIPWSRPTSRWRVIVTRAGSARGSSR